MLPAAAVKSEQPDLGLHVKNLLDAVEVITKHFADESRPIDPALVKQIGAPLCRLLKMLIPDVQQKMNEHIFVTEHPLFTISKHQHGHDLSDADGNHYEHKSATLAAPRGGRAAAASAGFNWPVPAGATEDLRRAALLKSIREKVEGGGAYLEVKTKRGVRLHLCTLSDTFLVGYFSRVKIGKSNNHRIGCTRCVDCGRFHKLEKLQAWSTEADARALTEDEWAQVLAPTRARCRVKKPK